MPSAALILLKKTWPYLMLAIIGFSGGFCVGSHIESGKLAAAKLALSIQETDDAKAAAEANAAAAFALAKESADADAAEAAASAATRQENVEDASLSGQIASQAAQPGQDAPDAPVLAHTLDALKGL